MIPEFIRASIFALGLTATAGMAEEPFIIVQSTTSTQNSGLLDYILPGFEAETGIDVRVVAVGTGQAIRNAINGDGDVLLVHSKPAEEQFVTDGWGVERFDVMYNDFVLVGPKSDPAKVKVDADIVAALAAVASSQAPFVSRGDDSGTHKAEMRHWEAVGVDPTEASGTWYREAGAGMGASLNVASGMGAYILTDRATWLSFGNRGDLEILVEGDPRLFNQYGVTLVNPEKHPGVRAAAGQRFIDWLIGPDGQAGIESYELDGQQMFFPNAN
ncbi:tungstate transport system substrate-binding protein [Ruegeria halocynthiae]|uniref:Tungstate transport system substrate-binding protein n=1 Tax=Ruegeria halocynthiae TaxID=985054 RepID=A0A1H2U708_9RHOB|nr:extracellular solute-binding protein [Ruegeria halocynthiae]SDW51901.1 tungstate transport system substrate-binding protein [Ruegeria halocynthiae]